MLILIRSRLDSDSKIVLLLTIRSRLDSDSKIALLTILIRSRFDSDFQIVLWLILYGLCICTGGRTWDALYELYSGIDNRVLENRAAFPQFDTSDTTVVNARQRLATLGYTGSNLQEALRAFQRANGLAVTGRLNDATASAITRQYQARGYSTSTRMTQYPGTELSVGSRDSR